MEMTLAAVRSSMSRKRARSACAAHIVNAAS